MKTINLLIVFLFTTVIVNAQDLWSKIPPLPTSAYSGKDDYQTKIQNYYEELSQKIENETQKAHDKVNSMSDAEKMQMAMKASTRYQTMTADEIIKMQQETQEIMTQNTQNQEQETGFDTRFNQIQKEMDEELNKVLGPIMAEYAKLPDGEGTPDWALEKGKQLNKQYDQKYEAICMKYITGPDALFKKWLEEYKTFLIQTNYPFQLKWYSYQGAQTGTPLIDKSVVEMEIVKKYLDRCKTISAFRKSVPRTQ